MFLGILETGYLDDLTRSKEITMKEFFGLLFGIYVLTGVIYWAMVKYLD